jgi:hypothetical protein
LLLALLAHRGLLTYPVPQPVAIADQHAFSHVAMIMINREIANDAATDGLHSDDYRSAA